MKEKKFRIVTRVTEKEYERIKSKAKKAKLSMSEFIRQAALKTKSKPPLSENYGPICDQINQLYDRFDSPKFCDEVRKLHRLITERGR